MPSAKQAQVPYANTVAAFIKRHYRGDFMVWSLMAASDEVQEAFSFQVQQGPVLNPEQPQLEPLRATADPQALRNPRPDSEAGHVYVSVGDYIYPPPLHLGGQAVSYVGIVTVITT